MKNRLPSSVFNPLSLTGAAIAAVSFGLILFLIVIELLSDGQKPYMGIIAFVVLPSFLILGLIIVAIGVIREHRREKAGIAKERKFPILNLNDPKHRTAATLFSIITIILLFFTAFGSFKAYEYTDSDEFCGTLCHSVMEPEFTAYLNSPHARVGCVKCHIGPGTDWFVRSKLSGAYQVYSVLFNKYSKPIPTPIENLRPARETCEQCHWPEHFFSEKNHVNTYYLYDENNTKFEIGLSMKVGGGMIESGITSGIHWHMNIANEISYISTDSLRMDIPWVKSVSYDGTETIYKSSDYNLTDTEFSSLHKRTMDCIDCHNRPSHIYHPPDRSINHLLALNRIDSDLPYIKSVAVSALESPYRTKSIALDSIKIALEHFYQMKYPQIYSSRQGVINTAINEIQKIYQRNYFPEMKVSWKEYPDHIGHMYAPGCFRCHSGKHESDDGKIISNDCNVCHTILYQSEGDKEPVVSLKGLEYQHPVDIGDAWKDIGCYHCHKD